MTTAIEHQPLVRGRDIDNDRFDAINKLVTGRGRRGERLLDFSYDMGDIIMTPRNYVGVIAFRDGDYLEILPKITDLEDQESVSKTKRAFLRMLLSAMDIDPAESGLAALEGWRGNPYEFFIGMFLSEVGSIVRQGIRSGYSEVEGNEPFVRGRILFADDLRLNSSHRERTYQSYQVFGADRAENRLIRATLMHLRAISCDHSNRREIRRLLPHFDGCSDVGDVDAELKGCVVDRNMRHYARAIRWCDVFLHGRALSTFSGSEVAYTFLFPMERVFESYVARTLKSRLEDFDVSVQERGTTMFDTGLERQVRPDIVVRRGDAALVLDTKWKAIWSNGDISDDDLRQMKEYSADFGGEAVLLYPRVGPCEETESRRGDIVVRTMFLDLLDDLDGWWERISLMVPDGRPGKAGLKASSNNPRNCHAGSDARAATIEQNVPYRFSSFDLSIRCFVRSIFCRDLGTPCLLASSYHSRARG